MSPRPYESPQRSAASQATRRRIVAATMELHAEQGVLATSMKQIAERAGVAVGSVYYHFPTYDDVVNACGTETVRRLEVPDPGEIGRLPELADRAQAAVHALGGWHQREWDYGVHRVLPEHRQVAALQPFVRDREGLRERMARAVLGRRSTATATGTFLALTSPEVFWTYRRRELPDRVAVREVTEAVLGWLDRRGWL